MDYYTRLQTLQILRKEKFHNYVRALTVYMEPGQKVISFKEVSDLKAELDDIYNLLIALENVYRVKT